MQQGLPEPEIIVVGVDIGGTTMSAGAVNNSSIISSNKVDTERTRSADKIVADVISLIESVIGIHSLEAIGIGVPTPAGPGTERLIPADNIPTLDDYPLKIRLSDYFGVPVFLENDANCMTVGEYNAGALRGVSSGACLTLGTGLGCGIIFEGSLIRGARYTAGEIWNYPTSDGTTLEDTVSIKALIGLAEKYIGLRIEPHELFDFYLAGTTSAISVWHRYGRAVGRVVMMVLTLFDPERIVIGGGIASAFEAFREGMIEEVVPVCGNDAADIIQSAQLSERAAIIGSAMLAKDIAEHGIRSGRTC